MATPDEKTVDATMRAIGVPPRGGGLDALRSAVEGAIGRGLSVGEIQTAIGSSAVARSSPRIAATRLLDAVAGQQPASPDQKAQQASARGYAAGAIGAIAGFDRQYPGVLSEEDRRTLGPQIQAALARGDKPEAVAQQLTDLYRGQIGTTKLTRAPSGPTTPTPGTPGGVDPKTLLDASVKAYIQHQPNPDDPQYANDATAYATDAALWAKGFGDVVKAQQDYRDAAAGITRLQDGTVVTKAQYDALDPMAKQQVDAWVSDQNNTRELNYSNIVNALGLKEYDLGRQQTLDANAAAQANFTNQNTRTATQIAYDQANTERAAKSVDRQLRGQAESRARADLVTGTYERAAPFATKPGKTDYTASDFGGLLEGLAAQAGRPAGETIFRTPGTVHLNPEGLLSQYDTTAGVGGRLTDIPNMVTNPVEIAQAPTMGAYGGPLPTLYRPRLTAPVPVGVGPAATPVATPATSAGVVVGPGGQYMDLNPDSGLLG